MEGATILVSSCEMACVSLGLVTRSTYELSPFHMCVSETRPSILESNQPPSTSSNTKNSSITFRSSPPHANLD